MSSRVIATSVCALVLATTAACSTSEPKDSRPVPATPTSATPSPVETADLTEHESGPESPLVFGLHAPIGATQMGPLFRYRSARLIAAYQPDLIAAEAERQAEIERRIAEDEANGTPSPEPTPTPTTRPSPDTFRIIEEPPRPDVSVALMRIDSEPSIVVRSMLAQINAAVPSAELVTNDLSKYCSAEDRRITECSVSARGLTTEDRDIRINVEVSTGDLATRTAAPASLTHPVMKVTVQAVGDPREDQLLSDTGRLADVEDVTQTEEISGLIWPKMDEDAPTTGRLIKRWSLPEETTLVLSGKKPHFAVTTTASAADADEAAEAFAKLMAAKRKVRKDVVEDLNSVSTTYTVRTENGATARAIYNLSARGNYTAFLYEPASK
jgi:hypothetical protein